MPDPTDDVDHAGDALATRGARPGADDGSRAAATAAGGEADGVPVAEMAPGQPRRRPWRTRRTFGVIGVAALLGIGGYAVASVQGNGTGGDSPEAAVHQLADAIDHEDALAAVATLNPSEVSTLQSTVGNAEHKAQQTKLVASSSSPFAGIDMSVNGLHTSVTTLADGIAKVTLSGSISAKVDAGELSQVLQRVAGNAQGTTDLARLGVHGGAPFLVTVERDGKWYVSPMYTAFEYVRAADDLPPADFGSADASKLGADSAQGAVEQLIRAIGAGDWNTVASLAPPDEVPLYEYRAAFAKLTDDDFGSGQRFTVDALTATPHVDGTNATVAVTASGTYPSADGRGSTTNAKWQLGGGCIQSSATYPAGSQPGFSGTMSVVRDDVCLVDHGPLPIALSPFGVRAGLVAPLSTPVNIAVVAENGRWFVSPMNTALHYLDAWIAHFDSASLGSLVHEPLLVPVTGELALDQRVEPTLTDLSLLPEYAHYTLHVDSPTDVVVDTRQDIPGMPKIAAGFHLVPGDVYGTRIYGRDGTPLTPDPTFTRYHLEPGTYDVTTTKSAYATLTIWRASDAPSDVPTGQPGCGPTPYGGEECTSSGAMSGVDGGGAFSSRSDSATLTPSTVP